MMSADEEIAMIVSKLTQEALKERIDASIWCRVIGDDFVIRISHHSEPYTELRYPDFWRGALAGVSYMYYVERAIHDYRCIILSRYFY